MTNGDARNRKRKMRTQILVDKEMQLRVARTCGSVMALIGVASVAVMYLLPSATVFERMNAAEGRMVVVFSVGGFFVAAIGVVSILSIVLTHRLAGPSQVIVAALRGMRAGDLEGRLRLRPKDYLIPIADSALALQEEMKRQSEEERAWRQNLLELVEEGDLVAVKRFLDRESLPSKDELHPELNEI